MEFRKPTPETARKALPIIAPIAFSPLIINSISSGMYTKAAMETTIGFLSGFLTRVSIPEISSLNQETTKLKHGEEHIIGLTSSLYEKPNSEFPTSQTSSPEGQELHQ